MTVRVISDRASHQTVGYSPVRLHVSGRSAVTRRDTEIFTPGLSHSPPDYGPLTATGGEWVRQTGWDRAEERM